MVHRSPWQIGRIERRESRALVAAPAAVAAIGRTVDAINILSVAAGALAGLALAGITLLMGGEILSRAAGYPLAFSWEYSAYLMSASFFLAGGFTLLSGGHVRVVLFLSDSNSRTSYILELIATAVAIAIFMVVAWALVEATMQFAARGTTSYTPMQTPLAVPTGMAAAGALVLLLQGLARLLGLLIGRADAFVFTHAETQEG